MKQPEDSNCGVSTRISRRSALQGVVAGTAAMLPQLRDPHRLLAVDYQHPVPEAEGLTTYVNHGLLVVRWHNTVILAYRSYPSLKYPYFGPLAGPVSGLPMTTESSIPYPHHRGLWLGCDPLNGGDYWGAGPLSEGQIVSQGVAVAYADESSATFHDACRWEREQSGCPLTDRRSFTLTHPRDDLWLLDIDLRLEANEYIRISSAKHSFFALRAALDLSPIGGGTLINSNGAVGAQSTFGQPADWCGFFGPRATNARVVEGITILNHPDNFGGDCPWFTRDYGHLSPSPFGFLKKDWTLNQGQDLQLKYCVALHAGTPQEANINDVFRQWTQRVAEVATNKNKNESRSGFRN